MITIYILSLAFFLPLLSFVVLIFFGRRMGEPKAGILGAGFMIASAVMAVASFVIWVSMNQGRSIRESLQIPWIYIGDDLINIGIRVDSLTIVMFTMVTVVSSAIFVFSIGYMKGDKRFSRFFAYLSLFGFSMLGLVLSNSLLGLFIFWELVGICSYLLIGFWFEKQSASNAAKKAFIVNRIGDFLFIVGIAIILAVTGNLTLDSIFQGVREGSFAGQGALLTFAGISLFFGAVGKSAQFPLHVWLPDAMEGPTPVSALIHAATMVAAGVYLVARIFPILTPTALLFIAYTGAITLFGSALIAIVATDIKRVLAYSTISQLGYMMLALGVGGWAPGLFHLITHACMKALLFLGSGSVIHGCKGEQDIRKMGRLHGKMPITSITFLIATLALSGVPFFSGAYSKDAMLGVMLEFAATRSTHVILFILPALGAAITAFYMMRVYLLTFHTTARDDSIYRQAHESPKSMWIPLVVLAALSISIGWFGTMPDRTNTGQGEYTYRGGSGLLGLIADAQPRWAVSWQMNPDHDIDSKSASLTAPTASNEYSGESERFHTAATIIATSAMAAGFTLAFLMYGFALVSPKRTAARFRWIYHLLLNKFFIDELYYAIFIAGTMKMARFGKWFDRRVLDGIANGSAKWVVKTAFFSGLTVDNHGVDGAVNGVGRLTLAVGHLVRKGQTGRVRNYLLITATLLAVGVFIAGVII